MSLTKKIDDLRNHESFIDFRPYQVKILNDLEKAIKDVREFSKNSVIMVERMWENRYGVEDAE